MELQRTPAQWYALVAGVFFAVLGLLTLVLTSVDWGTTSDPAQFLIWKASGWNTLLWMAMGAAGILASTHLDASRGYGAVAAIIFGALAIWGFIDGGYDTMGIFAVGTAGNITHAVAAVLGAGVALVPGWQQRRVGSAPPHRSHPAA
jgi:hypothetical protein